MTPAEFSSSQARDAIHPYVEQDLRNAEVVDLRDWTEAVFKVPKSRLDNWTSKIGELKWFEDEVIQQCLVDYCRADEGYQRYDPFTVLANRITARARGTLLGVPKTKSYPIDGIRFVNNADHAIEKIPEHGALGTARRLDILVTHGPAARGLAKTGKIQWVDILHWFELKLRLPLISLLDAERASRGMDPLDLDSGLIISRDSIPKSSKSTKRTGPLRLRQPHPQLILAVPAVVKVGKKRPPEDNLLDGLDLGSSNKRREYSDPNYDLYLGKDAAIQSGSYALELLSCTYGARIFCHGSVLEDDRLSLWYYDASGVVYTTQYLSLIRDFEKVAAIIVGLACCTPEQFGVLPTSIMKPDTRRAFPPKTLSGNVLQIRHPVSGKRFRVTLKDSLYSQYVLAGRRTFTYTMDTSPALSKTGLIAKFAYQVTTRKAEHDLVTVAHTAGVKHLPKIHMWADLWKMSEGTRRIFFEKNPGRAQYEDRTLRMIVYSKYNSIKPLFSERCELIPVMVEQMIDCLHDLRYKANMLHRDISVNNIMYEMRGDKFYFILIDFDMAVVVQDEKSRHTPSSKHRTGTLPFMAYMLVRDASRSNEGDSWKPIKHLLCHDYESLYWVALWCVLVLLLHTVKPREKTKLARKVKAWESGELEIISGSKEMICRHVLRLCSINLPPPAQCLQQWFGGWTLLFQKAAAAITLKENQDEGLLPTTAGESFDEDTAGGTFSRDSLHETLLPLMPFRQADIDESSEEADERIEEDEPESLAVPKVKRQIRKKMLSEEVVAIRARILSRLRPRKKTI